MPWFDEFTDDGGGNPIYEDDAITPVGQPPGDDYGPPLPGDDYGPPLPGDDYGPPLPGDDYGPPLPGDDYGPPLPGDDYGPPLPGDGGGPPLPGGAAGGSTDWQAQLKRLGDSLGLTKGANGQWDWSKLLGLGAAGITLHEALTRPAAALKTPTELLATLPTNTPPGFSPEALAAMRVPMQTGTQLTRQVASDMPSPLVAGMRYGRDGTPFAEGGGVEGALSRTFDSSQMRGLVSGAGGGQDDMVDAMLSPGEYVFDAEAVSMLGDGDNAAGARKLDELRERLRAHKRSAPDDSIAPKSMGPLSYMKGGLND